MDLGHRPDAKASAETIDEGPQVERRG